MIGQKSFDLIIAEEVTSQTYYVRHYTRPEWPGVSSGITIGIGYDLGYGTVAKIKADWAKYVSADMLTGMCACAGIKGAAAQKLLPSVKSKIEIPWNAALDVFANRDIPNWTTTVLQHIPRAKELSPDCLGVIVSLAYNRGASFDFAGDRYSEMREVKACIQNGAFERVPSAIEAMKRLWPNVKGLRDRRDHEAKLFSDGLLHSSPVAQIPSPPLVPNITLNAGPARTKPPATSTAQNTTTGAVVIGGTVAAQQAHAHGLISTQIMLFIAFLAVLGGITAWWGWYRNRNPKEVP